MPRKPVVHKSHSQNGADSSASKSAAAVHSSAQSLKDSVRSALMTGRTVSEVEHAPELFDVEAYEDSLSKTSSAKGASAQTASSQSVKGAENRFKGGFSKNWRLKLRGHLSFLFLHPRMRR